MSDKKTILLVDDDEDVVLQFKPRFEEAGFNVVEAFSRKEAEQKLESLKPDLAVIDLMMEEKDAGFILAYHIKKMDSGIPVIMMTAVTGNTGLEFSSIDNTEKSWVRADVILAKPVRFEQLMGEIRKLIK
ncbi:MAG: response regulator [Candidatus Margulisiibacteriota bacterium]